MEKTMDKTKKRLIIIFAVAVVLIYALVLIYYMWGKYYVVGIDTMAELSTAENSRYSEPIWQYRETDGKYEIYFDDKKHGSYTNGRYFADCLVEYDNDIFSHRIGFYTYETDKLGKETNLELIFEGEYRFKSDNSFIVYVDDKYVGEKTNEESELEFDRGVLEYY